MVTHRFAEQLRHTEPAFAALANSAFVPCPVVALFSPVQMAYVGEVYRIAAERTREQLRPQRSFAPAFSRN
jgi:hypothetical protein